MNFRYPFFFSSSKLSYPSQNWTLNLFFFFSHVEQFFPSAWRIGEWVSVTYVRVPSCRPWASNCTSEYHALNGSGLGSLTIPCKRDAVTVISLDNTGPPAGRGINSLNYVAVMQWDRGGIPGSIIYNAHYPLSYYSRCCCFPPTFLCFLLPW